MSNISLADVLHLAPRTFTFLQHGRSLNVLLATNTGTRAVVQQYVTHIKFPDQSHMFTFAHDQWPNLRCLTLQSVQDPSAVAGLSQGGDWQIFRLEPTFAKLDLDAMMALQTGTWPWQMLTDLAVYFKHCTPVDLHTLSFCQWPLLESLTLCSGRLGDAQTAVIFRADWPLLRSLRLPFNFLTHLEGVDHNRWPQLESVCLMDNPVSNTGLQRLVSAQWPKLTSLDLSKTVFLGCRPTLTWHQLIEANWPMLFSLNICGNMIKANMMKNIAETQFSCIRQLNLSNTLLDSIAVGHLVKGPWKQLRHLDLNSALSGSIADSLSLLSKGAWPLLELLWLVDNEVDVTALPALAQSKWPALHYLNLSHNSLSCDDFRLMGGDAACDEPRDMCRNVWPKLQVVEY